MFKRFYPLLLLCLAGLAVGCTSTVRKWAKRDFDEIQRHYERAEYRECLATIEKMNRRYEFNRAMWSIHLFYRGLCLEETGQPAAADELYREVIKYIPNTSLADRAKDRLARREADQREHFEFTYEGDDWSRLAKDCTANAVSEAFCPKSEKKHGLNSSRMLMLTSNDPHAEILTQRDVIERVRALSELCGGYVEVAPLEQSGREGIWYMHQSARKNVPEIACLIRVMFTARRVHAIAYARRNADMQPAERDAWVAKLKQARLVATAPPGGIAAP